MSFYNFARQVMILVSRCRYHLEYDGLENIPETGGFILCSNHISMYDPILVAIRVKPQCFFMAKEELFRFKPLAFLIRALGAFPVSRGKGDTGAIEKAAEIVQSGRVLAIFPEGHRSKDGKLLKLKSGAMVVASMTGAPLLPCVIKKGEKKGLRRTVTVRYGKLIPNEKLGLTAARTPAELRGANRLLTDTLTGLLEEKNG